jgi:hypothetical protein
VVHVRLVHYGRNYLVVSEEKMTKLEIGRAVLEVGGLISLTWFFTKYGLVAGWNKVAAWKTTAAAIPAAIELRLQAIETSLGILHAATNTPVPATAAPKVKLAAGAVIMPPSFPLGPTGVSGAVSFVPSPVKLT